jgi:hypothetical protein
MKSTSLGVDIMSKKSKRQSRKRSTPGVVRTETVQVAENRGSKNQDPTFNPDYSQTIKDLKRIGTLAGTFFVVLIVLSFFLR